MTQKDILDKLACELYESGVIAFEYGRSDFHTNKECPFNSESMKTDWKNGYEYERKLKEQADFEKRKEQFRCHVCGGDGHKPSSYFELCTNCCGVGYLPHPGENP